MKWCFLANDASFLMEFLGKLAHQAVAEGDECIVLVNSKIAEYSKQQFFPKEAKIISKVEWCQQHYDPSKRDLAVPISWKDFFSTFDRYKTPFDYKRAVHIVSQLEQFTQYIFENEKPDVVVSEVPSGIHNEIVYKFCQEKKIPYIGITDSLFDSLSLYDRGWTDSRFEKTFLNMRAEDIGPKEKEFIQGWIDRYVSHAKVPGYDKIVKVSFSQLGLVRHYMKRIRERGGILIKYILERGKFREYDFESEALLRHNLQAPLAMEQRQYRIRSQRRFYKPSSENDQFFLYPLQYQPEASSSVLAPYYTNQAETINNIAFSLPFPLKLYVKEHPMAQGKKPDEFYKALLRIPNIQLIHAKESAAALITACKGVVTLTSTMGLEAALAGKPVYVFGSVFYAYHPFCRRITNFDHLGEEILKDIQAPPNQGELQDINLRFISSYYKQTIPGDMAAASFEQDANNYSQILSAVRERAESS